jgi:hypothetical protein
MKAFISWSGSRELLIANAVKEWLTGVVPEVQSFVSPDLQKGKPWFAELAKELQNADIGFMCLAPPRVASDWQLVEAGAIWKAAGSGGLFPLCFHIREKDVPEPLRAFQMTHFNEDDFLRLATSVAKIVERKSRWTAKRQRAFEKSWLQLKRTVESALRQPDDGVHTARGFIHAVAGGWWERVWSDQDSTKLSWMWFEPSNDGTSQTITGHGFSKGGSFASQWETILISVQAHLPEPILEYYWEGRHTHEPNLLFGGKCTIQFRISANGTIDEGSGEFRDVCMNEVWRPTTKLVALRRATPEEIAIMTSKNQNTRARRTLADKKLKGWL